MSTLAARLVEAATIRRRLYGVTDPAAAILTRAAARAAKS